MSFGGPTKYCPRCNTLLPAQATVCSTCGLQFSDWAGSQPASGYGSPGYGGSTVYGGGATYGSSGAPGGWPQSQPQPDYGAYAPPPPPGYAPQPGYGVYPPAAVAAPPRKSNTGLIAVIVIVLLVVGGGAAGWFLYLNPSLCKGGPFFDRHGLASNIPLPEGCKFNTMRTIDIGEGATGNVWLWTVDSPKDPATLHSFYTQNLPGNGWTNKLDQTGSDGSVDLGYCGNGQAVEVVLTTKIQTDSSSSLGAIDITAPSGGSVLAIETVSDSRVVAAACG